MKRAKLRLSFWVYGFSLKPQFKSNRLLWKDKFDDPRCELCPSFTFTWLWFIVYGVWGDDQYWEQWLWVNKYCGGDYDKAKETWGWVDYETKESTWVNY